MSKINGQLDLSAPGSSMFIRTDSGGSIPAGQFNSFIGPVAGALNTEVISNTFIDLFVGFSNT